jgi:hypothetical protein
LRHPNAIFAGQERTVMRTLAILGLIMLAAAGCASREQMQEKRMAQQAAAEAEDDATCRQNGEPGTAAYDNCRSNLSQARADKAVQREQRAREFDRVLGAGTSGISD